MNGGEGRQVEALADLFEAGGVAVLLDEIAEVIENLALALRERQHARHTMQRKGESQAEWFVATLRTRTSVCLLRLDGRPPTQRVAQSPATSRESHRARYSAVDQSGSSALTVGASNGPMPLALQRVVYLPNAPRP